MNTSYVENGILVTVVPFGVSGEKKHKPAAVNGYKTGAAALVPKPRIELPMKDFTPEPTCRPIDELLEEIEDLMDQGVISLDDAIERLDAYHSQYPH